MPTRHSPQHEEEDTTNNSHSTHYNVLKIPVTSTYETIKMAYQQQARQWHPDRRRCTCSTNSGNDPDANDADANFLSIQKAWECLRDSQLRKEYDAHLACQAQMQVNHKSKSEGISKDQLEVVEDEETGELCYLYSCRCGEDVIWNKPTASSNTSSSTTKVYETCEGCSLVFHAHFDNQTLQPT